MMNGRKKGVTKYFLDNYLTFYIPNAKILSKLNENEKKKILLFDFNQKQLEMNRGTISNGTAAKIRKKFMPHTSIAPLKSDFCDFCSKFKSKITSLDKKINLTKINSNCDENEIKKLIEEKKKVCKTLYQHKIDASKEVLFYKEKILECKKNFENILNLENLPNSSTNSSLQQLKDEFCLIISADYMMNKILPIFRTTPQPCSTYYKRKFLIQIFGIMSHEYDFDNSKDNGQIFLFEEYLGSKNADTTISFIESFLKKKHPWIKNFILFMDNCKTNKNMKMIKFLNEQTAISNYNNIKLNFLISGHTKFIVDQMFSKISLSMEKNDVFSTLRFKEIIEKYYPCEIVKPDSLFVYDFKLKYLKLEKINSFRDFMFSKLDLHVKEFLYKGVYKKKLFLNLKKQIVEKKTFEEKVTALDAAPGQIPDKDEICKKLARSFENTCRVELREGTLTQKEKALAKSLIGKYTIL